MLISLPSTSLLDRSSTWDSERTFLGVMGNSKHAALIQSTIYPATRLRIDAGALYYRIQVVLYTCKNATRPPPTRALVIMSDDGTLTLTQCFHLRHMRGGGEVPSAWSFETATPPQVPLLINCRLKVGKRRSSHAGTKEPLCTRSARAHSPSGLLKHDVVLSSASMR
jgi:hypothetical protein